MCSLVVQCSVSICENLSSIFSHLGVGVGRRYYCYLHPGHFIKTSNICFGKWKAEAEAKFSSGDITGSKAAETGSFRSLLCRFSFLGAMAPSSRAWLGKSWAREKGSQQLQFVQP